MQAMDLSIWRALLAAHFSVARCPIGPHPPLACAAVEHAKQLVEPARFWWNWQCEERRWSSAFYG